MDNETLIRRFLEESNYHMDDNVLFILAYGSRITHTNKPNSDLDILIVTSGNSSYKRIMVVDGVTIDITVRSLDNIQENIYASLVTRSSYYQSILKNGIVILDKMNMFENIENLSNKRVRRKKTLDLKVIQTIDFHIKEYLNSNSLRHYYKALELLRRLHHIKNGCSYIRYTKVYDLYSDPNKASEEYLLKLPDSEYIKTYLNALKEENNERRLEYLRYLYNEFLNTKFKEFEDNYYLTEDEIKKLIFDLNTAITRCEDMIIAAHPYSKALYYLVLDEIAILYETIYNKTIDNIDIDFDSSTDDELIQHLENLFSIVEKDYKMNYSDIILRI